MTIKTKMMLAVAAVVLAASCNAPAYAEPAPIEDASSAGPSGAAQIDDGSGPRNVGAVIDSGAGPREVGAPINAKCSPIDDECIAKVGRS